MMHSARHGELELDADFARDLSVLTPTFRRSHLLDRVYASLLRQTVQPLEWIVVDDEPSQETERVVTSLAQTSPFPVRYVSQVHGHKKKAINTGVAAAKGRFILIWDDDDEAPPQAMASFQDEWNLIPRDERHGFVGVTGLCVGADGQVVGDRFPFDRWDSDPIQSTILMDIRGEKWGFQRTDILQRHRFDERPRGLVSESTVWLAIARSYRTRYVNQVVRTYHHTPGSLMNAAKSFRVLDDNCEGYFYSYCSPLDDILPELMRRPTLLLKTMIQSSRYFAHCMFRRRFGVTRFIKRIRTAVIQVLMFPVGIAAALLDSVSAWRQR